MSEIRFYHLTRTSLEHTLPRLLEKTVETGSRAVVIAASQERVEALTQYLWTYKPDGFLPHGNSRDGNAELQPIWLTQTDERPNGADVLILTDGMKSSRLGEYKKICDIFDGNDASALSAARIRWKECRAAGHEMSYWQQDGDKWARVEI